MAALTIRNLDDELTADAMIAAMCRHRSARLVTRNVKDFDRTGVVVVDPWSTVEGVGR